MTNSAPTNQNQNQKNQNHQSQSNQKDNNNKEIDSNNMNQNDRRFWTGIAVVVVIVILVVFGVYHRSSLPSSAEDMSAANAISTSTDVSDAMSATSSIQVYTYSCDNNKSVTATFHLPQDDFVNINTNDGRHIILAHAISADGARYANANESFVFWDKGVTAFITENGTTTYSGCVANRFP